MSLNIRALGVAFGLPGQRVATRLDDNGRSNNPSLWLPYADWQLTLSAFLAGTLRVVRNPYVVYALTRALTDEQRKDGKTVLDQLLAIYASYVTMVYGDYNTVNTLADFLGEVHGQTVPASNQPAWFVDAIGGTHAEFNLQGTRDETDLLEAVAFALAGSAAQAHNMAGLIDDESAYCGALDAAVGDTLGIYIGVTPNGDATEPWNIGGLLAARSRNAGVPLMTTEQLAAAGVPEMVAGLLETQIAPGLKVGGMANELFVGFADPDDLKALGITCTSTQLAQLGAWCRNRGAALRQLMDSSDPRDPRRADLWELAERRLLPTNA